MSNPMLRIAVSLGALLLAFAAYSWLLVPWIEPNLPTRARAAEPAAPTEKGPRHPELLEIFGEEAWERNNPKLLKTEQGMLLFKEYKPLDSSRLELRPCTLVFYSGNAAKGERRPVILRAPQRAILEFEGAVDLTRAKWGRLKGGRLEGDVTIDSPASDPRQDDALHVATRNVQIEPERIWTPHKVDFRWGKHFGSGRELIIRVDRAADAEPKNKKLSLGALQSVELVNVNQINLMIPGKGLLGEKDSPRSVQAKSADKAKPPTPVEITCRGPFRFDVAAREATFRDQVDVMRINPDGPADSLHCQRLTVLFAAAPPKGNAASNNPVPAGPSKLGATRLQVTRLRAEGHPSRLTAPSIDAEARAEKFEFDALSRTVFLEDPKQVHLRHRHQEMAAPKLEYHLAKDPQRLGRLWAAGPGELRSLPADEDEQAVNASWQGEVRLQPQGDTHVLSLHQGSQVDVQRSGSFQADRIFVWLQEQPRLVTGGSKGRFQIRPLKMLAEGNVDFESPQLTGKTKRVELWFNEPQRGGRPAAANPGAASPGGNPSGEPLSPPGADRLQSSNNRFELQGDLIRMQLVKQQRKYHLQHVSVSGNLKLTQLVSEPGEPPLTMQGDWLQWRDGLSPDAELEIVGRPVQIAARGMVISGDQLRMRQSQNRLWINGPGWMTLPGSQGAAGLAIGAGKTETVRVQWQGLMDFDGRVAHFEREVQVQGRHRQKDAIYDFQATSDALDVELTSDVDFSNPRKDQQKTEVRELAFQGGRQGVELVNRGSDTRGDLQSISRLNVTQLTIDQKTGALHGGPGWAESVQFGSDLLKQERQTASRGGGKPPQLAYLKVRFLREMTGNIHQREVHFSNQVRAVYGPVESWNKTLSELDFDRLPSGGVLLQCDKLTLFDMGGQSSPQLEMIAEGNTVVEGRSEEGLFTANAQRLSYVQSKDLLVLEGDGRTDALLSRKKRADATGSRTAARKIMYWRREGQIKVDSFSFLDLRDLAPPRR